MMLNSGFALNKPGKVNLFITRDEAGCCTGASQHRLVRVGGSALIIYKLLKKAIKTISIGL
ncbi:hypothetical protein DYBT9275_05708 [Dyadobacter sp. CECT 9275]|uniref:Uncharacterized protein n=1 Tax=Dyadobacter helix TaxID=2822344 RepID=A0A916JIV9_9BACT|nr:hypothetical protein DYBT9275_05708 [Dyadobacter sp. CECT 9275]